MKSVVSLLLCIIMLFSLSACGAGKERFVPEEGISTVSFDLTGMTVKGSLSYKGTEDITFTLTEPENLSGISFSKDEITADDVKISFSGPKEESPVYMLVSIMQDVAGREIFLPSKGSFTFKANMPLTEYKIIFDCEKGKIASIQTGKFTYKFE